MAMSLLLSMVAASPLSPVGPPQITKPSSVPIEFVASAEGVTIHRFAGSAAVDQAETCPQMHFNPATGQTFESQVPCTRREIEERFVPVCTSPCEDRLQAGTWVLAASRGRADPIRMEPLKVDAP